MYCFDRESRLFVRDKAGVSLPIGDRPIVAYGDQVTLTLKQVDATGAAVPLPPGATYSVVLARGYTNLLVYSESVTAAESGEITLTIHCNTSAFLEAITEKTNIIFELVEYTLDNTLGRVILGDTIRATPRATPGSVPLPDPEEPSAYTKAQTRALIASAQLPDKWPVPVEPLKYTDTIGYYAELLNPGDTVKSVYNVFDCGMAGVRIFSANPAVSGNITVKINHQNFSFFIDGEAQWVEMVLNQAVDGVLAIELVKGLTDSDGSPVSILITAVTVSGAMNISTTARIAKQVAAKPLLYSDTLGYYHLLDDNYLIEPCYRAENLTAVILKVRSANPEISGNAAIKITVGETVKSAVIPIGTGDTAAVVTLDAPASGVIKIERDTASSDDTLKDGDATVSVIVRDIQYNYVEE